MKRKLISVICSILMLAAMLAFTGCGGSGSSSSSSSGGGATISGSGE